jgi:hypothetical protein
MPNQWEESFGLRKSLGNYSPNRMIENSSFCRKQMKKIFFKISTCHISIIILPYYKKVEKA